MSFEKRLYEYEVTPPQKVWDKLSIALDDLTLENSFKKKLEGLKTEPPFNSWKKIEETLNSGIADTAPEKLYNLTETPPSEIWNRIDEQLIEDDFNKKFSDRLGALEINPPVGSWQKIAANLGKETPVVPFKKYYKPLRYAAAAVVIGLIAWGGFTLFNNSKNSTIAGLTTKKENTKHLDGPVQPPVNNISPVSAEPKTEIQETVLENKENIPHKTIARSTNNLLAAMTTIQDNHSGSEEIIADATLLQSNKKTELSNSADTTAPRYLVYLNEKGSLMKISKKLADLKCIYTKDGEISQDALAKLDRTICNDIVLCWQEKLALAPINFSFNPLEMADILK